MGVPVRANAHSDSCAAYEDAELPVILHEFSDGLIDRVGVVECILAGGSERDGVVTLLAGPRL